MSADKMDIENLLLDESFVNYCNGSSLKDVAFWEKYLETHPADRETIQSARDTFFQIFGALASADMEEQLARLNNKITGLPAAIVVRMDKPGGRRWNRFLNFKTGIAAVVLMVLCTGIILHQQHAKNSVSSFKFFEAAFGERKNVQLPDGSLVTLNSGSSVKIGNDFGITNREVCLKGEAFFDVKHDLSLPFIVHTKAMDVKALGTAFNVKAYRDERITETSLIRGIVEVTLKEDANLKMLLYPNEKIKWETVSADSIGLKNAMQKNGNITVPAKSKLKEKIVTTDDGAIKEIAWKANRMIFDNETFESIATLLERWYAVKINFKDNDIRNYRFTGVFEKEELNTVLDFLKESRSFNYSFEKGETLIINLSK